MKKVLLLITFLLQLFFTQQLFGQITIYFSRKEGVVSYVTGLYGQRNKTEAFRNCLNKGGKNPLLVFDNDGPGYWSIAFGKRGDITVIGYAAGHKSQQDADAAAIYGAGLANASAGSIYIYAYGNVFPPEKPKQNITANNTREAKWSDWKKINSSTCDLGIEYQMKREERYQLNYQLWFYYKVRNTSNKNISFVFNLTKNGKVQFSQPHVLSPGGEDEFMHKMNRDYIDGISVSKVINTQTNKDVCDNSSNSSINNISKSNVNSDSEKKQFVNPKVDEGKSKKGTEESYKIDEEAKFIKAQEDRIQKEQEVKKAMFDDAIKYGDNALTNKQFDNAMEYYEQAQNYASTDLEKKLAQNKYQQAFTAKRTAEREVRLEYQKEKDKEEDNAYTTMTNSAMNIMSLLNDRYTNKGVTGKFQFGLSYDEIPMILNQNNVYALPASYSDKATFPGFIGAVKLEFLNNKPVNFYTRALYSFGLHALEPGVSGNHQSSGIEGGIQFWFKTRTNFKLYAEAATYTRLGENTRDQDAINNGTTATDDVRDGVYKYNIFRYGGGPMLHWRNEGKETWIKTGFFLEKISFAANVNPTMSFSFSANIESSIIIDFSYSKNYPVAGTINYPNSFNFENQNYFSMKVIRQGNLW